MRLISPLQGTGKSIQISTPEVLELTGELWSIKEWEQHDRSVPKHFWKCYYSRCHQMLALRHKFLTLKHLFLSVRYQFLTLEGIMKILRGIWANFYQLKLYITWTIQKPCNLIVFWEKIMIFFILKPFFTPENTCQHFSLLQNFQNRHNSCYILNSIYEFFH